MNILSPSTWFGRKATDPTRNQGGALAAITREVRGLGPWHAELSAWEPRAVNPWLYEALKEAIPMLDGGINRLVTLDGIIGVEGDNDRVVGIIEDWMRNVPVNDLECGFQAAYALQGEEHYEQGIGVTEFVFDAKGRDVIGLRVADSKGVGFVRGEDRMHVMYRPPAVGGDRRRDGLGNVEQLLRGNGCGGRDVITALGGLGYVELDPMQLMFSIHRPEADNPYGTSVLRSVPFVAQILLRIQNSTARIWERFGDPSFHVSYKTANRKVRFDEAGKRADRIASQLGSAMAAKGTGNSVDLATGVGKDDDITLEVIGAAGEELQMDVPARHMVEQIVAAFGIPAWMLGVSWAQAAGIGEPQAELVIQDAKTRFARRHQALNRPIEAMLRARGITWKPGDWQLVQHLPSLHDEVKRAQAEFLRTQAAMMRGETAGVGAAGLDNTLRGARSQRPKAMRIKANDDDSDPAEPFAEPDPELPLLEAGSIAGLLAVWAALATDVLDLLGLRTPLAETWTFEQMMVPSLIQRGRSAGQRMAGELLGTQMRGWDRGIANAAVELVTGFDAPEVQAAIRARRAAVRQIYGDRGVQLVRGGIAREFERDIVGLLSSGVYDGQNPISVAADLRARFGGGDYNWERLARSEITDAQAAAKLDGYRAMGLTHYDYETAGDSRVSPICRALAAAGPYRLDDADAPRPLRDSHPNCRCSVRARQLT